MKPIVFEHARIHGIEHKIANSNVTSKIKCAAVFTAEVAAALDARWVMFDKSSQPKAGYKAIELDAEIKNLKMSYLVPKLEPGLSLNSEIAHKFKVVASGDGKKKPKKLMVRFEVSHAGSPFELLEHMIRVGGSDGKITLEALQQDLFAAEKAEKAEKAKPAEPEVPNTRPIPTDPATPEWRTAEEIKAGVPHHVESSSPAGPALASRAQMPGRPPLPRRGTSPVQ